MDVDWADLYASLKQNWMFLAGLGAAFAAFVGWILTYVGWSKVHQNNEALERQKFVANIELEKEKFESSLNLDRKRAELKFVSDQIQYLYGPLFSLGKASQIAFEAFMDLHAQGRMAFFNGTKRTPDELQSWRTWMSVVMMPLNLRMEQAIIENSHLIDGPSMPKSFQEFLGHVASYKAVLKKWDDAKLDGSLDKLTDADHVSITNFPVQMKTDVDQTFSRLRAKQLQLLSLVEASHFTAVQKHLT